MWCEEERSVYVPSRFECGRLEVEVVGGENYVECRDAPGRDKKNGTGLLGSSREVACPTH